MSVFLEVLTTGNPKYPWLKGNVTVSSPVLCCCSWLYRIAVLDFEQHINSLNWQLYLCLSKRRTWTGDTRRCCFSNSLQTCYRDSNIFAVRLHFADVSRANAVEQSLRARCVRTALFFSHDDFYTIIDLPEGTHEYKYFVDGNWVCDTKEVRHFMTK